MYELCWGRKFDGELKSNDIHCLKNLSIKNPLDEM